MTKDEHIEIHEKLHKSLDELVADFTLHSEQLPSETTVLDLMDWSYQQTQNPTVKS